MEEKRDAGKLEKGCESALLKMLQLFPPLRVDEFLKKLHCNSSARDFLETRTYLDVQQMNRFVPLILALSLCHGREGMSKSIQDDEIIWAGKNVPRLHTSMWVYERLQGKVIVEVEFMVIPKLHLYLDQVRNRTWPWDDVRGHTRVKPSSKSSGLGFNGAQMKFMSVNSVRLS